MATKCTFFVEKKQRTCRFLASPGEAFCGNHSQAADRVVCPIDSGHTILAVELQRHIHVCPAAVFERQRRAEAGSAYCPGVNAGSDDEDDERNNKYKIDSMPCSKRLRAFELSTEQWTVLLAKIRDAAAQLGGILPDSPELPVPVECTIWTTQKRKTVGEHELCGPSQFKHTAQQAALAAQLKRVGLLPEVQDRVFVEVGAGRGYLSALLVAVYHANHVILLDQGGGGRGRADRWLKLANLNSKRLYLNLADSKLTGLPGVDHTREHLVIVGKHLCGAATDFALRATMSAHQSNELPVDGVCIAPCCRHRCTWRAYVGKKYFRKLGLSANDFDLIAWMCSWAICGPPRKANEEQPDEHSEEIEHESMATEHGDKFLLGLSRDERMHIGLLCRRLVDEGRRQWLADQGQQQAELLTYVPSAITVENNLLLATFKQS